MRVAVLIVELTTVAISSTTFSCVMAVVSSVFFVFLMKLLWMSM